MEAKALKRKNLLVIRIANESTQYLYKQMTVLTTKTGGPSN